MKPLLKIHFSDFWKGYFPDNNIFVDLLSREYNVVLDAENPDIVIYCCFGKDYLKYKCIRIFYCCENERPDFTGCDYAITFDFNKRKNHLRYPLYGYYIDMYPKLLVTKMDNLFVQRSREELKKKWEQKTKFCCMVVSNSLSKKRIDFYKKLNSIKVVDSGGKVLNNVGGPVERKMEFIKDYRFVISFENSSHPGYTTEKVMEPIVTDSIPIYWGNPLVNLDFNEERILNYHSFDNEQQLIDKILELENNPEKALDVICAAPFPTGFKKPSYIDDDLLLDFLRNIINQKDTKKTVARSWKRHVHKVILFSKKCRVYAIHYWSKLFPEKAV